LKPLVVKILREIVLLFGIILIIGGLAQYQYGKVQHGVGTDSMPIETDTATPGSMIWVHTTSSNTTETRVIKMEERNAFFQNGTLVDKKLAAGGENGGGRGTDVKLSSWKAPARSDTSFLIVVLDGDGTTDSIENIEYTVEYKLWRPNYLLLLFGFFLILQSLMFRSIAKMKGREISVDIKDREPDTARARTRESPRERTPPSRAKEPPPRTPPARRRPPPRREPEPEPEDEYYPPGEADRGHVREPEPEVIREPEPARSARKKPVGRIRCSACGEIIPLYTKERPLRVTCPSCGRGGTLR